MSSAVGCRVSCADNFKLGDSTSLTWITIRISVGSSLYPLALLPSRAGRMPVFSCSASHTASAGAGPSLSGPEIGGAKVPQLPADLSQFSTVDAVYRRRLNLISRALSIPWVSLSRSSYRWANCRLPASALNVIRRVSYRYGYPVLGRYIPGFPLRCSLNHFTFSVTADGDLTTRSVPLA